MLLAAAVMTWRNFYFLLYPDTIYAMQVADFLAHLLRQLRAKLLIIWDRLPQRQVRLVAEVGPPRAADCLPSICQATSWN
jgi:hypothetical protein